MTQPLDHLPLAGFPVCSMKADALSRLLQERLAAPGKTVLLFANANFMTQCQPLRPWLCSPEVVLVNDGIGLDIAALLTHGRRYQANLNGTDFLPYLLKDLASPHKLFLMGAKPGVADKAAQMIGQRFGQRVVGCVDGYSTLSPSDLRDVINRSGADIVLVAMGNPLQEVWIRDNMAALNAKLLVGVGALFDFLAGEVRRAPRWVQQLRCEWLFRLAQEPRRLLKRYTVDIARFLYLCIRYK